jgi:inosine-uridine nucleoside N-ribohydrolase
LARIPVIIDTDPGVDDALALLVAAAAPELHVVAVCTVGGNVPLGLATRNAGIVLSVAWADNPPPLYVGAEATGPSATEVHGDDGLGGVASRYPPGVSPQLEPGVSAVARLLLERPGQISLLALGPLTNLAALHRHNPRALSAARSVVVMGGAFREPGNVTPGAEFNIHADPEAAAVVARAVSLIWVPLDVTHRCRLPRSELEALPGTPRAALARAVCEQYLAHHQSGYGEDACLLHDPAAVAALAWPELFQGEWTGVGVETRGELTRGATVADLRPAAFRARGAPPWMAAPVHHLLTRVEAPELVRRVARLLG